METLSTLRQFCQSHELPWDEEIAQGYQTYLELLLQFNRGMNLIGPMDAERIIDELFIDSLIPALATDFNRSTLDIGTGAGLPGIVLAIMHREMTLTLVEPRQKRTTFMRIALKRLGLQERVTLHQARIEDVPELMCDRVISKAFAPPAQWLEIARPWLTEGEGQVICMTRAQELPTLQAVAPSLGLHLHAQAERQSGEHEGMARMVYVFGQDV